MKKASKLFILAVCLLALVLAVTLVACDKGGQSVHTDHTASGDWQSDESGHWHICDEGGERTDVAAHNLIAQEQDGKHYFKCEVCDYRTEPEAHTPSATYSSDGTNHWQECTVCHLPVNRQAHTPDGEVENLGEDGHRFTCEVCKNTVDGAHSFDEENPLSDEQNHWLKCLFCDETTAPEAHTLGEYIIEGNEHSQQCEDCGATVNKAEHKANYALGYFADDDGHWYECECGQKMEYSAHEKDEANYTSNENEHWYSCKICLYRIEAQAHTFGDYISDGVKHYKQCSTCDRKALMADCVPSEQHVSADGEEYHNCATCGKKVTASAEEFYDMDEADHWLACPVCKKQLGDKVAHTGFTKYEFSIEGHWYVCDGCHNRVLSEHKYQDEICTECNYFDGLEFWTFAEQSDGSWYVTSYTGTQKVVKMPTRDADGHTITGFVNGVFSTSMETNPHNDYMEEVYVPESYTSIPYYAFEYCASLKKAHLPSSVSIFGSKMFANAPLEELYIEDLAAFVQTACYDNSPADLPFMTHGDMPYTATHTVDLYVKGELVKDLVIPEGVTSLGTGVFSNNCFGLNSITLPLSLTTFSPRAISTSFGNYGTDVFAESDIGRWVPKIIIPDYETFLLNCTVTATNKDPNTQMNEIDVVFMKDGKSVTDLVFPEGLQKVVNYQFMGSDNITTITLNEQLQSWGQYTFSGCTNIHAVRNAENTQLTSIPHGLFNGLPLDEPLKFPQTLKQFDDPGDIEVPIYFANGVSISIQNIDDYRGKEIAISSFNISAGGFGPNVKLDRVYFYNEAFYNSFVSDYRTKSKSSSDTDKTWANNVIPLYEAEAIIYSEECPEDADLQGSRWHWNAQGEIEFWSKTVNGDLVTFERGGEFWRDAYYHDVTNDGGEYTYRLKATAASGNEIAWSAITEGATVSEDGEVTVSKIGTYKIKAAVKDNEAIYSIATVIFYPSAFYYSGTLGGEDVLGSLDKTANTLGDREDLKFYDDGTHKSFTLYISLAKNDVFSVGYLGGDEKLGTSIFNKDKSVKGYMTYLIVNNADGTFKMRQAAVATITLTINDDNTLEIVLTALEKPSDYKLTLRGRKWEDRNSEYAIAYAKVSGCYGTTFTASVVYTATINDWLNVCFGSQKSNGATSLKTYDQQASNVYVFGDAFSTDDELNKWCSWSHYNLHLWYQSSEDGSGNTDSWEFIFTVRADGELLSVEINFAKDAEAE